jgi:hypothetical protein
MKAHIFASLLAVILLAGCPATDKKPAKAHGKASPPSGHGFAGDVSFQAFVGRLKLAAAARDRDTLADMMTRDFGYRWDAAPEDETPFSYWDAQKLWPRLRDVVSQRWTEHDGYMVVPPPGSEESASGGYRAGIAMIDGAWRFAYFVPSPAEQ